MDLPAPNGLSSQFSNHMSGRLLETRTVVHNGPLDAAAVRGITEQLTVLDNESEDPVDVILMNVPKGSFEAALSVYDVIRSMTAVIRILGSGRIAGAGVVAYVGASTERRFVLPHARFQLKEPGKNSSPRRAADLHEKAETLRDRRDRIRVLLSEATGQSEERIEADFANQARFDADEAVEYGLVHRVVEHRDEMS